MAARKPTRARPKPSKKAVAKKAKPAKTTAAKKSAKKTVAKKAVAKKAVAKKAVAKKAVAKKAVTKKAVTKKAVTKKAVTKKAVAKKAVTKKAVAKKAVAKKAEPRSTPARDALTALAQKKAINATLSPVDDQAIVDAYMRDVDHPFKAEMQAIREIILGASPKISERIKWNAPSFHYKEDLGAFHPAATEYAHLILLFPGGEGIDEESDLLEGTHKDRREAKFRSLDEVAAKKPALEQLVKRWVALRDS
jgi:hypothetical protein